MTQLAIADCGPELNSSLSQFYTPPALALRMVGSLGDVKLRRVIEPGCGLGALVKPVIARGSGRYLSDSILDPLVITAVDIDERNIAWCRENIKTDEHTRVEWHHDNYLRMPAPEVLYDLGITNPPFENNGEADFLAKLMQECERIQALIRTESLHGVYRFEKVWKHCHGRNSPWIVRTVSANTRRANFGGDGGQIETSVLKMSRRTETDGDKDLSCIDWW